MVDLNKDVQEIDKDLASIFEQGVTSELSGVICISDESLLTVRIDLVVVTEEEISQVLGHVESDTANKLHKDELVLITNQIDGTCNVARVEHSIEVINEYKISKFYTDITRVGT